MPGRAKGDECCSLGGERTGEEEQEEELVECRKRRRRRRRGRWREKRRKEEEAEEKKDKKERLEREEEDCKAGADELVGVGRSTLRLCFSHAARKTGGSPTSPQWTSTPT